MNNNLKVVEQIAPDLLKVIGVRFRILKNIYWHQPVGRRKLSIQTDMSERVLRTETDYLKQLELLEVSKSGMSLTSKGVSVYQSLEVLMIHKQADREVELSLSKYLGIEKCFIVEGDSDNDPNVLKQFGELVSDVLDSQLPNGNNTIAVMGGSTMATMSQYFKNLETANRHNVFVPARGGIGEAINVQANSISAMMAEKTGGDFEVLYVPEQLSFETYELLISEPAVQNVLEMISKSNVVIHSIGRALHMARRRKMDDVELAKLSNQGAVAESFGYFFNQDGEVVYKIPRIGLQMKDLNRIPYVIAVAGGKTKAKAIQAYIKNAPKHTWLITDTGAANQILKEATL